LLIFRESLASFIQILAAEKVRLVGVLILAFFAGLRRYWKEFLRRWAIWVSAAAALGAYGLVEFAPRLVWPFLIVIWVALLSAVSVPRTQGTRRIVSSVIAVIVLLLCLPVVGAPIRDIRTLRTPLEQRDRACGAQLKVARGLRDLGFVEGNRVAIIGKDQGQTECWAELEGLSIIGEIPAAGVDTYWKAAPEVQARILRIFARAGARAVVTYTMPAFGEAADWQRIDDTAYCVRFLDKGLESAQP
jgi:hypothetical protein